jgi:hypothetical protein
MNHVSIQIPLDRPWQKGDIDRATRADGDGHLTKPIGGRKFSRQIADFVMAGTG